MSNTATQRRKRGYGASMLRGWIRWQISGTTKDIAGNPFRSILGREWAKNPEAAIEGFYRRRGSELGYTREQLSAEEVS